MNKKLIYSLIAGTLFTLTSCDDFLDVQPGSGFTPEYIFSSESEMKALMTRIYSSMTEDGLYGSNLASGLNTNTDVEMSSFGCDGVIVSTPTGSTAYAFSAGGPIMWPNVKALQLVPLAAHALFARPLIIGAGSTFTLDILDDSSSEGWICCDGRRQCALPKGTRVEVRESKSTLRLARLSGVPFTNRLVTKFDLPVVGWREHARNGGSSAQRTRARGAADTAAVPSSGEQGVDHA